MKTIFAINPHRLSRGIIQLKVLKQFIDEDHNSESGSCFLLLVEWQDSTFLLERSKQLLRVNYSLPPCTLDDYLFFESEKETNLFVVKEEIKIVERLIKMLSRDLDYRSLELNKLKDKESLLESEKH